MLSKPLPTTLRSNSLRALELLLVLAVAFTGPTITAFYILISGRPLAVSPETNLVFLTGILSELLALAVLVYVLFQQGSSLRNLGLGFRWRDLPISVLIAILGYASFYLCELAIFYGYYFLTGKILSLAHVTTPYLQTGVWIGSVVLVLVNPFYEELIVRAFAISQVRLMAGSGLLAVAFSVGIQSFYHLYQGIPTTLALATTFLVYSLYYVRSGRILPVILAHLYLDFLALVLYPR